MQGVEFTRCIGTRSDPVQQTQGTVDLSLLQEPPGDIGHQFVVRQVVFGDPLEIPQESLGVAVHPPHQAGGKGRMGLGPALPLGKRGFLRGFIGLADLARSQSGRGSRERGRLRRGPGCAVGSATRDGQDRHDGHDRDRDRHGPGQALLRRHGAHRRSSTARGADHAMGTLDPKRSRCKRRRGPVVKPGPRPEKRNIGRNGRSGRVTSAKYASCAGSAEASSDACVC